MARPARSAFPSILIALLAGILPAQDRRAEVIRPEAPVRIDSATQRNDLIVVKFVEGHAVRMDAAGGLSSRTLDLAAVTALIGERRVERLFTRSVEELDREKVELERRSGWRLADLNNYYWVHTHGKADSEALLDDLLADPSVETAYPEFGPGGVVPLMPDIPPTTPNFESRQTYFNAPPGGYGYIGVRSTDGAQGLGRQIVAQLEGAWILGHEDAENLITKNIIGTTNFGSYGTSNTWVQHGTACFGIINATRNIYGVVGFAPEAVGKVSSLANGSANMINLCTAAAQAGDVFTSSFAYVVGGKHAPLDYVQSNFDAVKRAAAKGICYTFGAGNTNMDLADPLYGGRYAPNAPESGGFIIGGSDGSATRKAAGSNYGVKVIANGWYSGVTTIGYGSLFKAGNDSRQNYTATFGGTSAAGPQVAGVIAALQGGHMRQNGRPLTPDQVRALLKAHGTPVTGNIGKRPDLPAMMAATKVVDGMLVTKEPAIGSRGDIEVSASSGRIWVALVAAARQGMDVGLNRKLLLDPKSMFPLTGGVMGGSGKVVLGFAVPNDPSLRGFAIFLQGVDMTTSATGLHLTNSVEFYVR